MKKFRVIFKAGEYFPYRIQGKWLLFWKTIDFTDIEEFAINKCKLFEEKSMGVIYETLGANSIEDDKNKLISALVEVIDASEDGGSMYRGSIARVNAKHLVMKLKKMDWEKIKENING